MVKLLLRHGFARVLFWITLAAIGASELLTLLFDYLTQGSIGGSSVLISFLVPAVVAPVFAWFQLRLLVDLEQTRQNLLRLSITDELTQTHNRRYFFQQAGVLLEQAKRYNRPLSILLLDADDFKHINDTHGHQVGDQALQLIAAIVRSHSRTPDLLARYGGEEFVLLLPETALPQALEAAERLRQDIQSTRLPTPQGTVQCTVSVGIATLQLEQRLDDLLSQADRALYQAKNQGKNQVVAWSPALA